MSWEITGNHYLSLPCVSTQDGGLHSINVLHRGLRALLSWSAAKVPRPDQPALFAPRVVVDGAELPLRDLRWERLDRWIPRFHAKGRDGVTVTGTLCAPGGADGGTRGGVYILEVHNGGAAERTVEVRLQGRWAWTQRTILSTRALAEPLRLVRGADDGVALEAGQGGMGAALGLALGAEDGEYRAGTGDRLPEPLPPLAELDAPQGQAIRLEVRRAASRVRPGATLTVPFYLAVAPERDGALATAAALSRLGANELLRRARLDLSRLARSGDDPSIHDLANRNLIFNLYCAVARAIDDDHVYAIASRCPEHGETAVFAEREALYWSLPALTLADPLLARECLLRALELHSDRPGQHRRYIDGGVLSPGLALDAACAYVLALDRYVAETQDPTPLDEPLVQDILHEIDEGLFRQLHPDVFLCATELLPSGDVPDHDYVAYDNVLVWRVAGALARLWRGRATEAPKRMAGGADEIAAALWQRCTVPVEGLQVIACSTDLRGGAAVYDDPAGSMRLLPHWGFCEVEDPIWCDTMDFLHSSSYPLWLGDRRFPGLASRSAPGQASVAALCADLLTPNRARALDVLRRLDLPAGVAAETYDPDTGTARSAPYAAALAGFMAWALLAPGTAPAAGPDRRKRKP